MDMEGCNAFRSMGIYFDKKNRLVVFNGRWTKLKKRKS
jgi:hypothetical protein